MLRHTANPNRRWQWLGPALLTWTVVTFAPTCARAHFILMSPESWKSQDPLGGPQKVGPCGNEGGATLTGKVTAFRAGQTISVTVNEVIPHPGHYRVALAVNDRSELPPPPEVTPSGFDPCARAAIQDPPIFPVLADNMLPHMQPFAGPQTFEVTLPSDITCTKCTLQVLEYMSQHSVPCFYYHCADISIQGAVETATAIPTSTPTPTPMTPTATFTHTQTATITPAPITPTMTSTATAIPTPTTPPAGPTATVTPTLTRPRMRPHGPPRPLPSPSLRRRQRSSDRHHLQSAATAGAEPGR